MNDFKIDFVVTWVDGNDPEWIAEKNKYNPNKTDNSASANRFRDWDTMRFWFRGIEKFAPWVNKVFFVTCGHYPEWLNLDNPKLRLVKHDEYIPAELLPTFNSNTIEMFLYRIKDLSEHFVLFSDDVFLISGTTPRDFFVDGKPCDSALLSIISSDYTNDIFPHTLINNSALINKHYEKKRVLKENLWKFINIKYGMESFRNLLLFPFKYFSSFKDLHVASSHLKSVFAEVWGMEYDYLYKGSSSRFRSIWDINHWLFKEWYICKGMFEPRSPKWGRKFELGKEDDFCDYITQQRGKVVCLNDSYDCFDFEDMKKRIHDTFVALLPEKSSFEL